MVTKKDFLSSISGETKAQLLEHFKSIYEIDELGDHEYNMVYLCWLIKHRSAIINFDTSLAYNKEQVELREEDYEITIEAEPAGGYNYELVAEYYEFDKMENIV